MHFYDLYPEIRNIIYRHYFTIEDGYHFDHESRRLVLPDGGPIDLALVSTSSLIARETRSLPLHLNYITFSTGCTAATQPYAMDVLFKLYDIGMSKRMVYDKISPLLTPEVYKVVALRYPDFTRIMDQLHIPKPDSTRHFHYVWSSGGIPSTCEEASRLMLRTMVEVHGEATVVAATVGAWRDFIISSGDFPQHVEFLLADYRPWDFPSEEVMHILNKATTDVREFAAAVFGEKKHFLGKKFRYSAAAAAIDFLQGLPCSARVKIEKILLNEDQPSISTPSRHAIGLIPFCKENPRLKVERRVSLFGSVLIGRGGLKVDDQRCSGPRNSTPLVATWLVEALALEPAGMPPGSFSLVFYGAPEPELASDIFTYRVLRDAAWQAAFDEARSQGILRKPSTFLERVQHPCYILEDFPRAVMELLNRKNMSLRCDFPLDDCWDVQRLVQERRDWTWVDWGQKWFDHYNPPEWEHRFDPTLMMLNEVEPIMVQDGCAVGEAHVTNPHAKAFLSGQAPII